jgi:shikimate 5-dehydrogenase
MAQTLARELKQHGCALIVVSHDRNAAHQLAQELECRYAQFEALYTTLHDVLIVCDEEQAPGKPRGGAASIRPGYLKPGMTVLDLTAVSQLSPLVQEAEARGCAVVTPQHCWLEQVALQARLLTGKEVPLQLLADAAPWLRSDG